MSITKEDILFTAPGSELKLTSMNGMPFHVKTGKFEFGLSHHKYFWRVTETGVSGKPRTRRIKHTDFKSKLRVEIRKSRVSCYSDDQIFTGAFDEEEKCSVFNTLIEDIKRNKGSQGSNDQWLCAKSNVTASPITSKENITVSPITSKENAPKPLNVQRTFTNHHEVLSKENVPNYNSITASPIENVTPTKSSQREPLTEKSTPKFSSSRMNGYVKQPKKTPISTTSHNLSARSLGKQGTKRASLFPSQKDLDGILKAENNYVSEKVNKPSIPSHFYSSKYEQDDTKKAFASQESKMTSSEIKKIKRFEFNSTANKRNLTINRNEQNGEMVGFSNLGNTCYMNAVLQSLLSIPSFFQNLYNAANIEAVEHKSLYNTLCNLGMLKYSNETVGNQRFALQRVKDAVSSIAYRFSGYSQHDAHEFLCHCLDELKENLHDKMKQKFMQQGIDWPNEIQSRLSYTCPVKENFESILTHNIICQNCNEKVVNKETCHDFSLDMPNVDENSNPADITTDFLFQHFFEDEVIEDYKCEKCEANSTIISRRFSMLPRILVLHIKRYDLYHRKRNDRILVSKVIPVNDQITTDTQSPKHFDFVKPDFHQNSKSSSPQAEKRKSSDILIDEPLSKSLRQTEQLGFDNSFSPIKQPYNMEGELMARAFRDSKRDEELRLSRCNESFTKVSEKTTLKTLSSTPAVNESKNLVVIDDGDDDIFEKEVSINLDKTENGSYINPVSQEEEDKQLKEAVELSLQCENDSIAKNDDDFNKALEESLNHNIAEESDINKAMQESLQTFQESQNKQYLKDNLKHNIKVNHIAQDISISMDDDSNIGDNYYKLVGVVNHHGQNTGMGHYTSDNYDFKSKTWRSFNDSSVRDVKEHEVRYGRKESAYILFYMHSSCFDAIAQKQ